MQEQLTIWNDEADLLRRAAPPRVEWFPVPRRAAAMQPLVWLLALIPILFVAVSSPWNEVAARWGLRSLKLVSAETWSEFVDPGDIVPDGPLTYEAPLVTWCTAAAIWISGSSQPLAVIFPSAVCVYLLVIVGYELARAVGGPWMGMLTAILLATHPISQQLVQQPTSVTMGLVLALMTLWCLLRHLSSVPGVWSLWLLFGGIAWGLCLLSNGPLAISCVMIVAMFQATAPRYGTSSRRIIPLNRKADGVDWKRWKSLLLWFAIGAVAGGWWPLMMGSVHGPDFWTMWLGLIGKAPALQPVSVEPESWIDGSKVWFRQSAAFLPLLSGFLVLGAYRLIRIVCLNEEPAQRRPQHFLLVLTLFAVTMWVMSMMGYESGLFQRSLWNAFLLVPLAMLAAGGLQEIGERQAGFGVTLAAYGFGVLVAIWRYRGLWLDPSKLTHQLALVVGIGILFGVCLWLTLRFIHGYEGRQRWLVQGGIWGLLLAHCAWGVNLLPARPIQQETLEEQPLLQFWSDLRAWRNTQGASSVGDSLVLITARAPSSRLHYIAQSVWPRRRLKLASNWDGLNQRLKPGQSRIIVTYGKRELVRPTGPGQATAPVPIVPPRIYHQAELTAYELKPSPPASPES